MTDAAVSTLRTVAAVFFIMAVLAVLIDELTWWSFARKHRARPHADDYRDAEDESFTSWAMEQMDSEPDAESLAAQGLWFHYECPCCPGHVIPAGVRGSRR